MHEIAGSVEALIRQLNDAEGALKSLQVSFLHVQVKSTQSALCVVFLCKSVVLSCHTNTAPVECCELKFSRVRLKTLTPALIILSLCLFSQDARMSLEKEIAIKTNSIFIDKNKCMTHRTRYPTATRLQGYNQ